MRESDYGYDPPDDAEFDEDKERRDSVALDNRWKEDRRMADYDEDGANEERQDYKCPMCRDTGLGPYDGMRCPACSPGGKAWRERMSGDDDRPGPDDGPGEE